MWAADRAADAGPDRRPDPRPTHGRPLPAAGPGGAGPQGRVRGAAAELLHQGIRPRPGGRGAAGPVGADPAGQDLQAQHRDRGGPPGQQGWGRRREGAAAAGRLGRDRDRAGRGPGAGGPGGRGAGAALLDSPGVPVRQPVVRGAGTAELLFQRPLRRLPGLHRPGGQAGGRPGAGGAEPVAVAGPGCDRAVGVGEGAQRVFRPAADRRRRGLRHRPGHAVREAHRRAAAGAAVWRGRAGPRPLQESLRAGARLQHHL